MRTYYNTWEYPLYNIMKFPTLDSMRKRREQREEDEDLVPERIRIEQKTIKAIEDFNIEISNYQQIIFDRCKSTWPTAEGLIRCSLPANHQPPHAGSKPMSEDEMEELYGVDRMTAEGN
jgi:hypothetical protein